GIRDKLVTGVQTCALPISACTPSVSIIPGLIEFTRIFRGPSSLASTPVIASTAALLAVYTEEFGGRIEVAPEPMLMMLPPSGRKIGRASCRERVEMSEVAA